tara:strand:- start:5520 stop:5888 length:369 start_codon:yes stop_codon:yes gene_type:complete
MFKFLKNFLSFGFSQDGSNHWFWQRITAIVMMFLLVWIMTSLQNLTDNFEENIYLWIKKPVNSILFIFLFVITVHHATLGILNIFEDYIEQLNKKIFLIRFIKLLSFFLIVVSSVSILNIHF